jgi:hypothetical protein
MLNRINNFGLSLSIGNTNKCLHMNKKFYSSYKYDIQKALSTSYDLSPPNH